MANRPDKTYEIRDILFMYSDKDNSYWRQLFKYHHTPICVSNGKTELSKFLPSFVVVLMLQMAIQDILEREEIAFFSADRKPYMLWFIKDMRFVFSKQYKYRAKFRGHHYRLYSYLYPEFKARMSEVKDIFCDMIASNPIRYSLSLKVKKGFDYDACPNLPILYKLRKPVPEK